MYCSATSRVVPPPLHRNNEQVTALGKCPTVYHTILNYGNSMSIGFIMGLSNRRHALALQFPHPRWLNKHGNCESNSPFITLPLVVLAVLTLVQTPCPSFVMPRPSLTYAKNGELNIVSLLNFFCGKAAATKCF